MRSTGACGRLVLSAQSRDESKQLIEVGRLNEPPPCPERARDGWHFFHACLHHHGDISEPGLGTPRVAEFQKAAVQYRQVEEDNAGRQPRAE